MQFYISKIKELKDDKIIYYYHYYLTLLQLFSTTIQLHYFYM
jgi:hypothetical protein